MGGYLGSGFGESGFGFGGFGAGGYTPVEAMPREYYYGILTSEYQGSPNLLAWLAAVLDPLFDATECLADFINQFDLNLAIGAQLDILGSIIGVSRTVSFQPSAGVSPVLDDPTYRLLIIARLAQNSWNGLQDSLQGIWQLLFPGGRIAIADAQNMTATVILSGAFTSILVDLINHGYIVPRPEGVLYNYVFPVLPAFGFDQNSAYIAGFDLGHWS